LVYCGWHVLTLHAVSAPCRLTVDEAEVRKFGALAAHWWRDDAGPFAGLHQMNAVRVPLVQRAYEASRREQHEQAGVGAESMPPTAPGAGAAATRAGPLAGARVLDVGCGGGILSEALARLGARVTGLDAAEANIRAAQYHALHDPGLAGVLDYTCSTAEELAAGEAAGSFDVVVASEVIEHVADAASFMTALAALVKVRALLSGSRRVPTGSSPHRNRHHSPGTIHQAPIAPPLAPPLAPSSRPRRHPTSLQPGGHVVLTTINRTVTSFGLAILAAEYVLRLVPAGTHEWAKFITPEELERLLRGAGLQLTDTTGLMYHPIGQSWTYIPTLQINYAMTARRPLGGQPGAEAPAGGDPGLGAPSPAGVSVAPVVG
jgi:ubiquinone biosynthesis O-methyltransferase